MPLLKSNKNNLAIDIIKKYCHINYSLSINILFIGDWKEFYTELIQKLCPSNVWILNCLNNPT